jgi:large subunit ribosomal protein L9
MRVILTKNVPKLGEVGDVREVAAGYGRNYLIPQGMAVPATVGAMRQIETLKRIEHRRLDKVRGEMEDLARRIDRIRLTFPARVGETGRLYGSITAAHIAEGIQAQLGQEFDRRKIVLDESLRTLGEHIVPVHLMPGVDAEVKVDVVAEEEPVPAGWRPDQEVELAADSASEEDVAVLAEPGLEEDVTVPAEPGPEEGAAHEAPA